MRTRAPATTVTICPVPLGHVIVDRSALQTCAHAASEVVDACPRESQRRPPDVLSTLGGHRRRRRSELQGREVTQHVLSERETALGLTRDGSRDAISRPVQRRYAIENRVHPARHENADNQGDAGNDAQPEAGTTRGGRRSADRVHEGWRKHPKTGGVRTRTVPRRSRSRRPAMHECTISPRRETRGIRHVSKNEMKGSSEDGAALAGVDEPVLNGVEGLALSEADVTLSGEHVGIAIDP